MRWNIVGLVLISNCIVEDATIGTLHISRAHTHTHVYAYIYHNNYFNPGNAFYAIKTGSTILCHKRKRQNKAIPLHSSCVCVCVCSADVCVQLMLEEYLAR